MIVEDERHLLQFLNAKLAASGEFEVKLACATAEEALGKLGGERVDVAFIDIEMPRMNGLELAAKLREQQDSLRIIFTTAYDRYAFHAFEVEAVDYLLKPISDNDIQRVIRRLQKLQPSAPEEQPEQQLKEQKREQEPPVRCFGCFEAKDGEGQLVKWPTRKAEELFAYLLIHQDRLVSKWELLDLLWKDMDEERGLDHLYSTVYRMKQVLKLLPMAPTVNKVNNGYVLRAEGRLSDAGILLSLASPEEVVQNMPAAEAFYFGYTKPLFGNNAYDWSTKVQSRLDQAFAVIGQRLIDRYRQLDRFEEADKAVRHYASQLVEDEVMMVKWLRMLEDWPGHEGKILLYRSWFNDKLAEADLPLLQE